MSRVLFLDIDGPCHPVGTVSMDDAGQMAGEGAFCWLESLLQLLRELPDVEVVVHSTWRLLWPTDDELRAHLPPALAERVVAATPRDFMGRHPSIQAYCAVHRPARIAIVDDEPGAFPEGLEHLVTCEATSGLSDPAVVERLREALGGAAGETE